MPVTSTNVRSSLADRGSRGRGHGERTDERCRPGSRRRVETGGELAPRTRHRVVPDQRNGSILVHSAYGDVRIFGRSGCSRQRQHPGGCGRVAHYRRSAAAVDGNGLRVDRGAGVWPLPPDMATPRPYICRVPMSAPPREADVPGAVSAAPVSRSGRLPEGGIVGRSRVVWGKARANSVVRISRIRSRTASALGNSLLHGPRGNELRVGVSFGPSQAVAGASGPQFRPGAGASMARLAL